MPSKLWKAGTAEGADFLPEARLLDLEASLRRAQGRFAEALELLDRALVVDRGELAKRLLLNKATVLYGPGRFRRGSRNFAIRGAARRKRGRAPAYFCASLQPRCEPLVSRSLRRGWAILPDLRKLAVEASNELDLVRLRWLEGRIAAGFGHRDEARTTLSRVREEFTSREIAYDVALVSLELSCFYLEEGLTAEVRNLSRQMMWIFRAQGVPRGGACRAQALLRGRRAGCRHARPGPAARRVSLSRPERSKSPFRRLCVIQPPGLHRPFGSIMQPSSAVTWLVTQRPSWAILQPSFVITRLLGAQLPLGSIRQPASVVAGAGLATHRPEGSIRHPAFNNEPVKKRQSEPTDESAAEIPGAPRRAARVSAAVRVRRNRDMTLSSWRGVPDAAAMAGRAPLPGVWCLASRWKNTPEE